MLVPESKLNKKIIYNLQKSLYHLEIHSAEEMVGFLCEHLFSTFASQNRYTMYSLVGAFIKDDAKSRKNGK